MICIPQQILFGFIHMCRCRLLPTTTHVNKNRSCNYSLNAPEDER